MSEINAIRFAEPWQVSCVKIPMPEPKPGEALIKIMAAGICGSDHADQNIVFLVDLRLLEINDLQFIRFNDLNALHKIFLLKSDNGLKDFDNLSARWADGSGPC